MGYDNPKIEFVIHYQTPGSAIAYYQQVGRAGRAVDEAYGVALSGTEDVRIQDYFIETAFPSEDVTTAILDTLGSANGLSRGGLLERVNMQPKRMDGTLKVLEVEQAVYREASQWYRSASARTYPRDRVESVNRHRRREQEAMVNYVTTDTCLMAFLRSELDDDATSCARCANCAGDPLDPTVDAALSAEAHNFIRLQPIVIEPRKQATSVLGALNLKDFRLEGGHALTRYGDPGWGEFVQSGKYQTNRFDDQLVEQPSDQHEQKIGRAHV